MSDLLPGRPIPHFLSMRARTILEAGLATPVCLWSAWRFVASFKNRNLNVFTAAAMSFSSVSVLGNLLRLGARTFEGEPE